MYSNNNISDNASQLMYKASQQVIYPNDHQNYNPSRSNSKNSNTKGSTQTNIVKWLKSCHTVIFYKYQQTKFMHQSVFGLNMYDVVSDSVHKAGPLC